MEVLVINGHDYSHLVKRKGVGWKRNDLDSEKTKRTRDGTLRRDKITTKRTVSYEILPIATQKELAQLDDDLSAETFSARYLDLHGIQTRTFYCSSFSATLEEIRDGETNWSGGAFNMIEV
mgnify:CR=1 FL=1